MRKGLLRFSWIASLAAAWGLAWGGMGWVQEKSGLGGPAKKEVAKVSPEAQANRAIEIQVELAWLGDPVTFPYYLEAHAKGSQLEVRGYVPSKAVRDHAIRLATLNSPLAVVDQTREHSSLAVRPVRLAPEKLQASAQTALASTLPTTHKKLRLECSADGKVLVGGDVKSLEEKLQVSQALRRLHGCGHVVNITNVEGASAAGAPAAAPRVLADAAPPLPRGADLRKTAPREAPGDILPAQLKETPRTPPPPAVPTEPAAKKEGPFGGFFQRLFGKKTEPAPSRETTTRFPTGRDPVKITNIGESKKSGELALPLPKGSAKSATPYESPGVILAPGADKTAKRGKALPPAQVKTRLEALFPKARPIAVASEGGQKLRVELTVRSADEIDSVAGRVLAVPELEPYEVNLQIRVDAPVKDR